MAAIPGVSPLSRKAHAQGQFFGAQRFPAVDVDSNDNIYLMMCAATAPASEHRPHSQIFFAQSRDGGSNWDNLPLTRKLTNSPGEAFGPSLAVFKNGQTRAYVTYHDNSNGTTQAYLISSKKKAKFRKAANITPHDFGAISPRLAVDSGEGVNIVWSDLENSAGKIVFIRSTDQGFAFTPRLEISRSSGIAFEPEIAVDPSDGIHVVWQDSGSGTNAIMFSSSTDHGQTFSEPRKISGSTGPATEAAIASDSLGRLSVAWVGESSGRAELFYSRSTDRGLTFSEPANLSKFSEGDVHKPTIATFQNTVYVAFQNGGLFGEDTVRNRQVFLARSRDGGASFEEAEQVSRANSNNGRAHSPAMVVDSRGMLHIFWIDSSIVGNDEGLLFYSKTANGQSFSSQFAILAVL